MYVVGLAIRVACFSVAPLFIYRLVFIPLEPLQLKSHKIDSIEITSTVFTHIYCRNGELLRESTCELDARYHIRNRTNCFYFLAHSLFTALNSITIQTNCAHVHIVSSATVIIIDDDHDCDICTLISMQKIADALLHFGSISFSCTSQDGK